MWQILAQFTDTPWFSFCQNREVLSFFSLKKKKMVILPKILLSNQVHHFMVKHLIDYVT